MNQSNPAGRRRDSYRAALRRDAAAAGPHPAWVTTVRNRYVAVTVELPPEVHRGLARWAGPPAAVLGTAAGAASRVLGALAAPLRRHGRPPSS